MAAIFASRSSATSQMAYSSALRVFRQASKCAICAMGPQPRTPMRRRRGSLCTSNSIRLAVLTLAGKRSPGEMHQERRWLGVALLGASLVARLPEEGLQLIVGHAAFFHLTSKRGQDF